MGHKRYFKCSLITEEETGNFKPEFNEFVKDEKLGYLIMYSSNPGKSGSNDCTIRIITTPGSVQGDKFNSTSVDNLKQ